MRDHLYSNNRSICCSYNYNICSIFCSIPDPTSDNEMHRVHREGDLRCSLGKNQNPISFHCPKCTSIFTNNDKLQSNITQSHEEFDTSFQTMSLVSEGSISDICETCKQCGKAFQFLVRNVGLGGQI